MSKSKQKINKAYNGRFIKQGKKVKIVPILK
jgi:hypothetical protein